MTDSSSISRVSSIFVELESPKIALNSSSSLLDSKSPELTSNANALLSTSLIPESSFGSSFATSENVSEKSLGVLNIEDIS